MLAKIQVEDIEGKHKIKFSFLIWRINWANNYYLINSFYFNQYHFLRIKNKY